MALPETWHWHSKVREPGECAVFDLDGVLADANGRQHFLTWPSRDWDGFFAAAVDDELIEASAQLLHLLAQQLQIVLLTARPMFIRADTLAWLDRHGIAFDLLIIRPTNDRRPSARFKRDAVRVMVDAGFMPRIAFEDDARNVEMLRDEGIPCVYIHSGYYG